MHLSDAHCAPQDQTSNLCGWGKASAMYNKSALHIGCKYNVLRWCSADFELVQRLALLMTYEKHLSGAQAARVLTTLYMTTLTIAIPRMIGFGRDSVSANAVTLRSLTPVFTHAEDILCICHTLMNMGKHFLIAFLEEFYGKWISIIYGTSPQAKPIWKRSLDVALVGFSTVRWYCEAEIIIQNAAYFPLIRPFLSQLVDEGICPTLAPAALALYDSHELLLKLQHAAMVDMKFIISTTYEMEGDLIPQILGFLRSTCMMATCAFWEYICFPR